MYDNISHNERDLHTVVKINQATKRNTEKQSAGEMFSASERNEQMHTSKGKNDKGKVGKGKKGNGKKGKAKGKNDSAATVL